MQSKNLNMKFSNYGNYSYYAFIYYGFACIWNFIILLKENIV